VGGRGIQRGVEGAGRSEGRGKESERAIGNRKRRRQRTTVRGEGQNGRTANGEGSARRVGDLSGPWLVQGPRGYWKGLAGGGGGFRCSRSAPRPGWSSASWAVGAPGWARRALPASRPSTGPGVGPGNRVSAAPRPLAAPKNGGRPSARALGKGPRVGPAARGAPTPAEFRSVLGVRRHKWPPRTPRSTITNMARPSSGQLAPSGGRQVEGPGRLQRF